MYNVHGQLFRTRLASKACTAMESRLHKETVFKHQHFHCIQYITFKHQLFQRIQSNTWSSQLFLISLHIQLYTQHRRVSSGSSCAHNSRLYYGNLRLWHGTGSKPYVEVKNKNKTKKEWATSNKSTSFCTRNRRLKISYCVYFLNLCNVTNSVSKELKKFNKKHIEKNFQNT